MPSLFFLSLNIYKTRAVRPSIGSRLQKLSAKVKDISGRHLSRDIVGTVAYAWGFGEELEAIHNDLVYLWMASCGEERPLPVLTTKFSHEDQMPLKKDMVEYIASNRVHCEAAARLEDDEAIWFLDELQEVLRDAHAKPSVLRAHHFFR
jgi:hypothetical protein